VADALTHAGQIAMLRRMAGRVGADQAAPVKQF
jgi:hypothetical protein